MVLLNLQWILTNGAGTTGDGPPERQNQQLREVTMGLQELKDSLAVECFGMTLSEAHEKRVCIFCKSQIRDERGAEPSGESGQIYSDAGMKEYSISGVCESCFDGVM